MSGRWTRLLTAVAAATTVTAATGCDQHTTNPGDAGGALAAAHAGDTLRLAPDSVVNIGLNGVQLVFRAVSEDSRCPINAVCVWAGNATVELDARMGRSAWKRLVVNSDSEPRHADYGAWRFHLLDVAPPQETPGRINPADYRVTVAVRAR